MEELSKLQEIIDQSDNIVFFGGAGVSTESGIPDFRSVDGIYQQKYEYPPETILSRSFFYRHTEEFYRFYRDRVVFLNARPNPAHIKLAQLEKVGKLRAVITQNIDGLHQLAGSKNVLELHGTIQENYCLSCNKQYDINYIIEADGVPLCSSCGGKIKPKVVLYEEALDTDVMARAINYIKKAEVLIIGGTSLIVYPAAGLIDYYQGNKLVLINKDKTSKDKFANYIYHQAIGNIFDKIEV